MSIFLHKEALFELIAPLLAKESMSKLTGMPDIFRKIAIFE